MVLSRCRGEREQHRILLIKNLEVMAHGIQILPLDVIFPLGHEFKSGLGCISDCDWLLSRPSSYLATEFDQPYLYTLGIGVREAESYLGLDHQFNSP